MLDSVVSLDWIFLISFSLTESITLDILSSVFKLKILSPWLTGCCPEKSVHKHFQNHRRATRGQQRVEQRGWWGWHRVQYQDNSSSRCCDMWSSSTHRGSTDGKDFNLPASDYEHFKFGQNIHINQTLQQWIVNHADPHLTRVSVEIELRFPFNHYLCRYLLISVIHVLDR